MGMGRGHLEVHRHILSSKGPHTTMPTATAHAASAPGLHWQSPPDELCTASQPASQPASHELCTASGQAASPTAYRAPPTSASPPSSLLTPRTPPVSPHPTPTRRTTGPPRPGPHRPREVPLTTFFSRLPPPSPTSSLHTPHLIPPPPSLTSSSAPSASRAKKSNQCIPTCSVEVSASVREGLCK